jgi:Right handed beta helix region
VTHEQHVKNHPPTAHLPNALLCPLLIFAAVVSVSAQLTVEVNQSDPASTHQTIGAALADVTPGSTILVHPGVYEESVAMSGITIRSLFGPEVTVIQSPDGGGDGVTLSGDRNVALIGFRVQGFVNGIVVSTSDGTTTVANCIATANSADGILINAGVPTSAKILNNIAADNGGDGIQYPAANHMSGFNNIMISNGQYGLHCDHYNHMTFGDYNCMHGNTSGDRYASVPGPNDITDDPLMDVNMHYRFSSMSSPAVNAGHPTPYHSDPDGSRNDMGAYGGPHAADWWRDPFTGPTVENVTVNPPQVPPGGVVTINATARTE